MNRTQMMAMSDLEFATFLSNLPEYMNEDFEPYAGIDPNFFFLLHFTRARRANDFDLMTGNFEVWNELHMRTREYAQSLPRGNMRRSIYYSSANEVDHITQTPPRVRPVVARVATPPLAPRREYNNNEMMGVAGGTNRAARRLNFDDEEEEDAPRNRNTRNLPRPR